MNPVAYNFETYAIGTLAPDLQIIVSLAIAWLESPSDILEGLYQNCLVQQIAALLQQSSVQLYIMYYPLRCSHTKICRYGNLPKVDSQ
jgi:hypothetical protein